MISQHLPNCGCPFFNGVSHNSPSLDINTCLKQLYSCHALPNEQNIVPKILDLKIQPFFFRFIAFISPHNTRHQAQHLLPPPRNSPTPTFSLFAPKPRRQRNPRGHPFANSTTPSLCSRMARACFVALACGMLTAANALKVSTPTEGQIVIADR